MRLSFQAPLTRRAAWGWIILATLAAHFLLPFCTLIVSDDWFTLLAYRQRSFSAAWKGAVYLSMPLTVLQTLPFFLIGPNLFILRLINLLVLMAQGVALYTLIVRLRPRAQVDALWVAVFAVTFPGYLTHFMVSFLFYQLGFLLFLCSLLLTLEAEDTQQPKRRRWLMAAAALLVFYSFHFGALLIFYCFYILAHLYYFKLRKRTPIIEVGIEYLKTRYLYLILPFWFWGFRQAFGLLVPTWTEYNQPSLSIPRIWEGLDGFEASYRLILEGLLHAPLFSYTAAASIIFYLFGRPARASETSGRPDVIGAVTGAAVLFAGIIPFVLVGKYPITGPISPKSETAFGLANHQILTVIDTRMHLFLGLAAGLVFVHLGRLVCQLLKCPRFIYKSILVTLLAASINVTFESYVFLERKAMLVEGVRETMQARKELSGYGIIGIIDNIGNISTTWDSWVLFLETVWGDRAHHGIPERWVGESANANLYYRPSSAINKLLYGGAWYGFFHEPAVSKEASIILSQSPETTNSSDAALLFQYYLVRYFQRAAYPGFVSRLVRITVCPKRTLEEEVGSSLADSGWQPLNRMTPFNGPSELRAEEFSDDLSPPPSSSFPEFNITRPLDGAGRLVLISASNAISRTNLDNFTLVDARQRILPTVNLTNPHGSYLLGVAYVDSTSVHLANTQDANAPLLLHRIEGFQQNEQRDDALFILPEPYVDPAEVYPEIYGRTYDIFDALYDDLLFGPVGSYTRPTVYRKGQHFYLSVALKGEFLDTGAVTVTNDHNTYVRIDWGIPTNVVYSRIQAIGNSDTRLMDLAPPAEGGVRYYEVPKPRPTTTVSVRLFSDANHPCNLPKRISIADVDKNAILTREFEKLFPR